MTKRRGNQEGSLHERKDGSWRAQITLNGERLSFSHHTRRECQEWLKRIIKDIDSGLTYTGANMKLSEYLDLWMNMIKENRRQKTYIQYRGLIKNYILPAFGNHRLRDLQPIQIEKYLTQKKIDGIGERTCQLIYSLLHTALRAAVKKGLIGRDPMDAVEKPKVRNPKQIITLEPDQVHQLLIAAMDDRNEVLYQLAVVTGMREGEIIGLKWEDIDWVRQRLKVQRQVQYIPHQGLIFSIPKTHAGVRTIALGTMTIENLQEHQQRQQKERAAAGERWHENNLIFPTVIGTPLDPGNLLKNFKVLLQKAGLPEMRFHDLRHTSITLVLNEIGAPIKEAQRRAGHASPSTTINIYGGEATSKLDEMVAQSLDELITPVKLELHRNCTKKENLPKR